MSKSLSDQLVENAIKEAFANSGNPFPGVTRVSHNERGTGTVMACKKADSDDLKRVYGEASVGDYVCEVDWDDGGTIDLLFLPGDLTEIDD